jgi:outer membrane immunogenic protein
MKKLLLISIAFAALIAGPATAADLARPVYRRPVVVAAPVYTWSGFYVGGNVGGSWGDARTDIAGSATTVALPGFLGGFPGNNVAFADSNTARLNGVIGGGQIGYNIQFSPRWVSGFEADIQGSGERGSNVFADPFSTTVCTLAANNGGAPVCQSTGPLNATAVTAYDAKISWFGTVRGRLGFLIGDHLVYGTGGLAYGHVELSGVTNVSGSLNTTGAGAGINPLTPGAASFSESRTKVGFAVGGGIEGKCSHFLPAGWTWKLEYLYVDLGSVDTVAPFPGGASPNAGVAGGFFTSPFTGAIATHTRFTDNVVRVGLNYKFGYAAAPALYK